MFRGYTSAKETRFSCIKVVTLGWKRSRRKGSAQIFGMINLTSCRNLELLICA